MVNHLKAASFKVCPADIQFHIMTVPLSLPPFTGASGIGGKQEPIGSQGIMQFIEDPGQFLAGNMKKRGIGKNSVESPVRQF